MSCLGFPYFSYIFGNVNLSFGFIYCQDILGFSFITIKDF